MATLFQGMNLSLDGYVDHDRFAPDDALFRHFTQMVGDLTGSLYGRRLYELMRYWDEDQPDWTPDLHDFARAWRAQPKWVASRTLTSVGPNSTLLGPDLAAEVRRLKSTLPGEIQGGGPVLAHGLSHLGLIGEYRLYIRPVVLGRGNPSFAGPCRRHASCPAPTWARMPYSERSFQHSKLGPEVIPVVLSGSLARGLERLCRTLPRCIRQQTGYPNRPMPHRLRPVRRATGS
ncbi:dihydrofolate reductase family protein [Neotabrizicola shimadae]|uniref:Dihydrofolate reductase family protein n=1 Tax=Neotabrizicola shimadae TaxID=2807096 RepID=A0A8G0ZZ47_9RHOB|nr:dihydrofolate reductase family protein [Neotabrizicola shimadae]